MCVHLCAVCVCHVMNSNTLDADMVVQNHLIWRAHKCTVYREPNNPSQAITTALLTIYYGSEYISISSWIYNVRRILAIFACVPHRRTHSLHSMICYTTKLIFCHSSIWSNVTTSWSNEFNFLRVQEERKQQCFPTTLPDGEREKIVRV